MSRLNSQDYCVLNPNRFNEYCAVLGLKELSCYDPDKKAIERAFRKRALKTHPDKGGDPVEFKKINDAYNRLMGHISKLEQQAEQNELAESILIEVSKTSLPKWVEKLKRSYGYFKSNDCKCIIFEGPYKQFKGRSKNTGPITVVLYEDPQDGVPKIHIRSRKYMAWIAEQMMPVHMHVDKGRTIQFDQWRIAHVAEFGIEAYKTPPTPAPERKPPPTADPKPKRKARDSSVPKPKTRRDSEPSPHPGAGGEFTDKENKQPDGKEWFSSNGNPDEHAEATGNGEEDPFPKVYNMADGTYTRKKTKKKRPKPPKPPPPEYVYNCGHCGEGFNSMLEFNYHKTKCIPDEDFGFNAEKEKNENKMEVDDDKTGCKTDNDTKKSDTQSKQTKEKPIERPSDINPSIFNFLTGNTPVPTKKTAGEKAYTCNGCGTGYDTLKEYSTHKNDCIYASPPSSVASPLTVTKELQDKPKAKSAEKVDDNACKNDNDNNSTEVKMSKDLTQDTEKLKSPISAKKTEPYISPPADKKIDKGTDSTPNQKVEVTKISPVVKKKVEATAKATDNDLDKVTISSNETATDNGNTNKMDFEEKPEKMETDIVLDNNEIKEIVADEIKSTPVVETLDTTELKDEGPRTCNGHSQNTKAHSPEKDILKDKHVSLPKSDIENTQEAKPVEITKVNVHDSSMDSEIKKEIPISIEPKQQKQAPVPVESTPVSKSINQPEEKKKEKIKMNLTKKVKKSTKSQQAPTKKIVLEKEIFIDSRKNEDLVKVADSKLKAKVDKESNSVNKSNIKGQENIQMESLKENLPAAVSAKPTSTATASKNSEEAPSTILKHVDPDSKFKTEPEDKMKTKLHEEEHSILKNKNIQELQNALKPRVSFSDDLPLASSKSKSGRFSKDSPKLLRKDELKKTCSKFSKPDISPKSSPTILKKSSQKQITSPELKSKLNSSDKFVDTCRKEKIEQKVANEKVSDEKPDFLIKPKKDNDLNKMIPENSDNRKSTIVGSNKVNITNSKEISDVHETKIKLDKKDNTHDINKAKALDDTSKEDNIPSIFKDPDPKLIPVLSKAVPNVTVPVSSSKSNTAINVRSNTVTEDSFGDTSQKISIGKESEKSQSSSSNKSEEKVGSKSKKITFDIQKSNEITDKGEDKTLSDKNPHIPKQTETTNLKNSISAVSSQLNEKKNHRQSNVDSKNDSISSDIKEQVKQTKNQAEKDKVKAEKQNVNTFHELDAEAIRLANNILQTPDSKSETPDRLLTNEHSKKTQLNMRPLTKHHLEEQHSLDHEAIKVSNNIFSDNTRLSEKELEDNNEKIQAKSRINENLPSSKSQPTVHQAKQYYVVNKAVIPDKTLPNHDLIKSPTTENGLNSSKESNVKKDESMKSKESDAQYLISSVIYTKSTQEKDPPAKAEVNKTTASNVIYTKSIQEKEVQAKPVDSKKLASDYTQKSNISKDSARLDILSDIDFTSLERRKRVHEEDHRQKAPSSLGTSRFEDSDFSRPIRNATHSDFSSLNKATNHVAQSSSFAFDTRASATPSTQRRFQDKNFNVAPAPFSGKYNVHFSESTETGLSREKSSLGSSYQRPAVTRSETTSPNRYNSNLEKTDFTSTRSSSKSVPSSTSYSTSNPSRAKSEGFNRFGGLAGEATYHGSTSSSDLMKRIQASKDTYRQSYETAMNFDRSISSKPVVVIPKLPRPGNNYDKYLVNAEREKAQRRMERDRSVVDKLITDRSGRSTSTHK